MLTGDLARAQAAFNKALQGGVSDARHNLDIVNRQLSVNKERERAEAERLRQEQQRKAEELKAKEAERLARELDAALSVLSSFDEGFDLVLHYKYLMVLAGFPEYRLHFNPTDALSESQRRYTEAQWHKFKTWYAAWVQSH